MDFEEALQQFEDQSIDLLHIDGSHQYEAVKKDFETWLPKLQKGGLILMHDILVEREDYGVKKFWEEIARTYSTETHQIGFGLGIIKY
jgi:predicted O-methyltransferase YrrM